MSLIFIALSKKRQSTYYPEIKSLMEIACSEQKCNCNNNNQWNNYIRQNKEISFYTNMNIENYCSSTLKVYGLIFSFQLSLQFYCKIQLGEKIDN